MIEDLIAEYAAAAEQRRLAAGQPRIPRYSPAERIRRRSALLEKLYGAVRRVQQPHRLNVPIRKVLKQLADLEEDHAHS